MLRFNNYEEHEYSIPEQSIPHPLLIPQSESLIPFRLIQTIATNHFEEFLEKALEAFGSSPKSLSKDVLMTSCVHTVCALSIIFSGENHAKDIFEKLRYRKIVHLYVQLPSEKHWNYEINDLFSGNVICEMNRDPIFSFLSTEGQTRRAEQYIKPYVHHFLNHTQPLIEKAYQDSLTSAYPDESTMILCLEKAFQKLEYNFNQFVLQNLRDAIVENNKVINEFLSVIYYIALIEPHAQDSKRSCFKHICALEQYWCPINKEPRFRLYQSWIRQATLGDDIHKQRYDDASIGSWDLKAIASFLINLDKLCSNSSSGDDDHNIYKACFGYPSPTSIPLIFENQEFKGISLRYYSACFRPVDCLENYREFIGLLPQKAV